MLLRFRSQIIWFLARWHDRKQKQIAAASGIRERRVSRLLRGGKIEDEEYESLLAAVARRPAEVEILTGCIEDLEDLSQAGDLTDEEQAEVERGVREGKRLLRRAFIEAARCSRSLPVMDGYPRPEDLEPARWHAETLWSLMKEMTEEQQLAMVQAVPGCRSWALVERVCAESEVQASRDVERAASLARLAMTIAEKVQGPESWRNRVQGYAALDGPNILRVIGEFKAARTDFERAKRLWCAGSDPDYVLDPGRALDLEASLCREERQFEKALALLDEAREVSHSPGRILVKKGFTLEVMGDFECAIDALLQAALLVNRETEPRLWYKLSSNLAVSFCHVGRYAEAAELIQQARPLATDLEDTIDLSRLVWLEGRIATGQGRTGEAWGLLEQARREFAARGMWYDVALVRLEMAILLLEEGRTADVTMLARELVEVFESKGVHRETLAALRLFSEAAEREEATIELARHVLLYLFRARYDQGLLFTASGALGTAARVESAARVGHGLRSGSTSATGIEPAPHIPGGQKRDSESNGEEDQTHRDLSCAAPASGLRGPRGPRLPGMVRQEEAPMTRKQRLARLVRALSGKTQNAFGESTGVDSDMIALYELGKRNPSEETLQRLAKGAGLTVDAAAEVLRFADTLREPRRRAGRGASGLLAQLQSLGTRVHQRLLRLPPSQIDTKEQ